MSDYNNEIIDQMIDKIKERHEKLDEIVAHTTPESPPSEKDIQDFYRSKAWLKMRKTILERDMGISQYLLLTTRKAVPGNVVHHLIEIRTAQGWPLRLEPYNLETVDKSSHNGKIHPDRASTKKALKAQDKFDKVLNFKLKNDITTDNGTPEL